jgi:hypothetical protein
MVVDSDEDRDGFFETLAVMEDSGDGHTHVEAFRRDRDGTMHAIRAEELKKMEDMLDSVTNLWKEALPPK